MTKTQRQQLPVFLSKLRELCADFEVVIRVRTGDPQGPCAFLSIAGSEELEFMGACDDSAGAWHEDDEEPIMA